MTGDTNPWVSPEGIPANVRSKPIADLGRPWRPYASVTYLNCWMGDHLSPKGWNNWGKTSNEETARYAEYGSTGPGANPEARVKWAKQLTDAEAGKLTVENILAGTERLAAGLVIASEQFVLLGSCPLIGFWRNYLQNSNMFS